MCDYPLPIAGVFRNIDYSRFEAVPAVFYPDRKMIPERERYVDSVWPLDTRTGRQARQAFDERSFVAVQVGPVIVPLNSVVLA